MTEVLLLLLALLLTAACAVFVAAEFSLTTVERGAVERAAANGERGAATALKAVGRLTFQLSGAQLGITITSLVIGMIAQPSVAALLRGPLTALGLPEGAAETVAVLLGVLLSTVVLMVAGELVPKNWAISRPLAVAKVVAGPQYWFSAAFSPFIGHLNDTANRVVRRVGLEPAEHLASARTPQELVALARHSARAGAIAPDTAELFVRSLNLRELTAENVMTPRVDVRALEERATAADVANLTRATGLSRFPVYRNNLDQVVGAVHIKDALTVPADRRHLHPVANLMTEPLLVPETLTVDRLLDRLRGEQTMAVVIDEYGGTAGIATLEDIVEEVVGEVVDEHDPAELADLIDLGEGRDGRHRWDADGITRTDQLEAIGLPDTDGPYETLAGLIADRLGRIPVPGDRVGAGGWLLEVKAVAHHVAERVRITAPERGSEAETENGSGGGGGSGSGSGSGTGSGSGSGTGEGAR
ncbi:hemolysin family protein [Kitasatospora sp. NPDC127111]|uniref:hemolysin family protein n=1 Tax=Kitasatospora sp. NPDC127111 TaxID=3345363 RepID=UPI00362A8C4F